jgi:hypothetical protein
VLNFSEQSTLFTQTESTTDDGGGKRRRHIADMNGEVDEVKVKATFTGNTNSGLVGELHDVYLGYAPAQRGSSR